MLGTKQIIVDLFLVKGLLLGGALITLVELFFGNGYTLQHASLFFILGGSLAALAGMIKPDIARIFISRKAPVGWIYKRSITLGILGGLSFAGVMHILLERADHSSAWFISVAGVVALVHTPIMVWDARRVAKKTKQTS